MKRQWPEQDDSTLENKACKRCTWSEAEDQLLLAMATKETNVDWAEVANAMRSVEPRRGPTKTAKQCRERWHNRVNPIIKQEPWTAEEEDRFFDLHQKYGAKWSEIATELTGRTDNTIKNYFYCRLRKIARRIKKGMISDDMKTSAKEVDHTIYLINYLRGYVNDTTKTKRAPADKYIAEMARTSTITTSRIDSYIKEYLASVKLSSPILMPATGHDKVSETDDSLSKIQAAPSDVLPPISQLTTQSNARSEATFEELYALAQLEEFKHMYPNKEFARLPMPERLNKRFKNDEDGFKPTFNFTQPTAIIARSSSTLLQYVLCKPILRCNRTYCSQRRQASS